MLTTTTTISMIAIKLEGFHPSRGAESRGAQATSLAAIVTPVKNLTLRTPQDADRTLELT
jgi:hypothetical protein